ISRGSGSADEYLVAVTGANNTDLIQAALDKGKPSQATLDKAYELALSLHKEAAAGLLKKAGAHDPAPDAQVEEKTHESYAGTYKSGQLPLDIKVFVKERKLYMQVTGQNEFAPRAKSATVFEFAPAQVEVDFDSPSSFTLKQGANSYQFKKVVVP